MHPVIIVILLICFALCLAGTAIDWYVADKYPELLGLPKKETPQQPAATENEQPVAVITDTRPEQPRMFAFMMRMRLNRKADAVPEQKKAA